MRAWGMLLLAGCTVTMAAQDPQRPPPPRQEVVAPRAGFVWVQGRWEWHGGWAWIGGHWEREREAIVMQTTTPDPPPPRAKPVPRSAVIVWSDRSPGNGEIYVKQWDGQAWRELAASAHGGGISNTPTTKVYGVGESAVPALALDANGYPVVAWIERIEINHHPLPHGESTVARDEIFVRRWNGTAWVELAGSGHGVGISDSRANGADGATYPSIAIDRAGKIVVAWQYADLGSPSRLWIAVKRWNGRAWEDLGDSSGRASGTRVGAHASLAIDPEDRPVIAWSSESNMTCVIAVQRWSGAAWEPLGSTDADGISGSGGTSDPSLAIDRRGNPVVIWPHSGNSGFGARAWDGRAWNVLTNDPKSQSCTAGLEYGLAIDVQGAPIVGQHQTGSRSQLRVSRWTGSAWTELSSPGQGFGRLALATDGNGDLLATWADNGIHAARWDGHTWRDLGLLTTTDRAEWPIVAAP